jgi:hypothetical protein
MSRDRTPAVGQKVSDLGLLSVRLSVTKSRAAVHQRLMRSRTQWFGVLAAVLLAGGCGLEEHPHPAAAPVPPSHSSKEPDAEAPSDPGDQQDAAVSDPAPQPTDASAGQTADARKAPVPMDAAPMSGITIDINGVKVPREKALVFIHWGHSNMAGHGINPASLQPFFYTPQPRLWSYQGNGVFVPAKEQTAPDPTSIPGGGPGMAWLRTAAAAAGPDYHFISIARGRGSATTSDYLKGGLYYSTFMDKAIQLKGKVTFAGMFIMMGITDRHMPLSEQGGFADRMAKIVADIRADLGEPNLPVLHTDYEVTATGDLAVTTDYAVRIRPLILSLPKRITNLAIVNTDGITLEDDHHFTLAGHKLWAERGVQIMIDRGWFPWQK